MDLNVTFRNFILDSFQIQAISELENGHSLVLAAPTGSGKTLIAEYLIEKILKTDRRVIYTSPIKALSNQKFRDFSALFPGKVGILTGDVVVNREAQALIMTTEIYRNMSIEDPGAIHDVDFVIYDEIHYLGDIERGTVWEESIIFSPPNVRFLCLSATIPNADEFARWIESVANHKVSVITYEKRAVPLSYLFFENGTFLSFKDLQRKTSRKAPAEEAKKKSSRHKEDAEDSRHIQILKLLKSQDRLPLLYFAFSRALVDKMTDEACRQFDFTTKSQKERITELVENCIEKYGLENLDSAQILYEQVIKGIGRHHAGLVPQLKELVEILFSEKLLKVLYVTETFAMGVNMPARTVAFDALRKFDGKSFRQIKTMEFRQISGRAGRRGIDEMGWVVIPYLPRDNDIIEIEDIVYGDIEPLLSQFDLSFNSVLNLYSGHESDEIRMILKKNFAQFQANKNIPPIADKVADFRNQIELLKPRCLEKKNDLDAFQFFFKRKQEIIHTFQNQMTDMAGGLKGRKNRVYSKEIRDRFSQKMAALDEEENKFICGQCPSKSKCTSKLFKINKLDKKLEYWRGLLEAQEQLQLPIYEEKVSILRKLGYLDDKGLLPRGEFAAKIHIEEIAVTELFFKGILHEWNYHEINALAVALTSEFKKRGVQVVRPQRGPVFEKLKDARGFINSFARQYKFLKPLDLTFSMVMYQWSIGDPFDVIMTMTSIPEGDLIRLFRQAIDLLRQIRDAVDENSLRDKLSECVDHINRDIVLATELRD
ncbi:MAG: DEAD/DEAH box helicase [Candidatus Riflebacteria bacterium]|nr:DEAD/DEAH box helicase [Candidatus Riflebacteria bacterium]